MAKAKLTDKGLKKLVAINGKQTDYFDEDFPGFAIRVNPSGKKSFCVFYRIGRRFKRHTIGIYPTLGLSEARQEAKKALYRVTIKGEDPSRVKAENRDAITFSELAQEFLAKHSKPNKRSWEEDARIIEKNLDPVIGPMRAKDVSRPIVREMLEDIADEAPVMANRVLALVRKIFNWGIQRDILELNPCANLEAPGGPETARDRVLNDDEIKKVWDAINQEPFVMGSMMKLRLLTAQRGGEVASMRWNDLDLDNAVWTIPGEVAKNGNLCRVPLAPEAVKIIKDVKAHTERENRKRAKRHGRDPQQEELSPWVFPGRKAGTSVTEVQKLIQRVRAGTSPDDSDDDEDGVAFKGHDLRRTAASKMTELGVPRLIVKKILNHADNEITAVYDRFGYDREKRAALELWAKRLMVIVSGLKVAIATTE